jgi:hypothetical protein
MNLMSDAHDLLGPLFILTMLVVSECAGATIWLRREARRARGELT